MSLVCTKEVMDSFAIPGTMETLAELKRGHIHDTYVSTWRDGSRTQSYVHQKLNSNVFKNISEVMANVERVLSHIENYGGPLNEDGDSRRVRLVYTNGGQPFMVADDGAYWRTYEFVPGTTSYLICENADLAFNAARVCGYFQRALCDLSAADFATVIPNFTNMLYRYEQLCRASDMDVCSRKKSVAAELEGLALLESSFQAVEAACANGEVPRRVTHNDLKYNNVLFDIDTKRAVCVVDLDTCMEGTILYDYGDLLRTTATPAREDERDPALVVTDSGYIEALTKGYLEPLGAHLTPKEVELMPRMPAFVTRMIGIRFLTDYLSGDVYFKTGYPEHNLVRAKNQFKLADEFDRQENFIKEIVATLTA